MTDTTIIDRIFRKLYGQICWGVKQGHGSFLTLEFGNPHLEIKEPKIPDQPLSRKVQKLLARRLVTLHGDWHLWIYCCDWFVFLNNKPIADSASKRQKIKKALAALEGQKLSQVFIDSIRGRSLFKFDLGGSLETRRYNRTDEQWILYEPSGYVLTIRADGRYSYQPGSATPDQQQWYALNADRRNLKSAG